MSTIPAIVLAAGGSRRLGQPKQLLRLNGETLLARVVRLAFEAGLSPVLVVLGAQAELLRPQAMLHPAQIVINAEWEQGLSTSIRAGLTALEMHPAHLCGVMLLTCDQPRLSAAHLIELLQAFLAHPQPAIACSFYAGDRGIPAIFPRAAFPLLQALSGDKGAKDLVRRAAFPIVEFPFPGGEIDIDAPSDLARLA